MREFVFTIQYEPESDPVMDVFIEHSELVSQSLACAVSSDSLWRLDRFGGPDSALDALDSILFESERCEECIGRGNCHGRCEYELVAETPSTRTVYTCRPEMERCHSVPYLATQQLGGGLFFETIRRDRRYRWRVLLRETHAVGRLYDTLQSDLREGITLHLEHYDTPTRWGDQFVTVADLPAEQRVALEAAVEYGYYETPRETTAETIAAALDVPQSTFQYRLQRAETWLATQFATDVV